MKVTPKTVDAEIRVADARAKALRAYRDWTRCPSAELRAVAERKRENWRGHVASLESLRSGWINWSGGECPVDDDAKVEYAMRYDEVSSFTSVSLFRAGGLRWIHMELGGDIIRYRVVQ